MRVDDDAMNRRAPLIVLVTLLATAGFAQQPSPGKLAITLSIASPVVASGAPIDVTVVAKNIGNELAQWSTVCNAALDYKLTVSGPDARPVKPTRLYEQMLKGAAGIECTTAILVAPGEERKMSANLGEYFEMTTPGKYLVQAIRYAGCSNKLEITITN
jgi:hypothetical protein